MKHNNNSGAAESPLNSARAKHLHWGRTTAISLCLLTLLGSLAYLWMTQDAVAQLSFLRQRRNGKSTPGAHKSLVSIDTWQTASTLMPQAISAEEQEYAHDAERLADHEVDQAFAIALRMTALRARHITLSGDAQELKQRVSELEQTVKLDAQQVRQLGGDPNAVDATKKSSSATSDDNDDLELAIAQLRLDSGELEDARKALAHVLGDNSDQIQQELNAYHLAQQQAENNLRGAAAEHAVTSVQQHRTLQMRIAALMRQKARTQLIEQAAEQVAAEAKSLTAERAAAEQKLTAEAASGQDASRIEQLRDREGKRQVLAAYTDRIEMDKALEGVYGKWIAQIALQRHILLHYLVESLAWVLFIILAALGLNTLAQRLLDHMQLDNRQSHTLRTLVRLGIQLLGAVIILLIVFGIPQQTSTVLGLTTAALTIALQDFILAFFGWFLLMGRKGIHVGDWVEINGVHGEVAELGLFNTTLLELSSLTSKGRPTGRSIAFLNSFAIRGQYFNFSTSSQWMWDDVSIGIPKSLDVHQVAAEIEAVVREKTADDARAAALDWQRVARNSSLLTLASDSTISMRPTAEGIEATVHYITRATERFATRDQLYLELLELLQKRSTRSNP